MLGWGGVVWLGMCLETAANPYPISDNIWQRICWGTIYVDNTPRQACSPLFTFENQILVVMSEYYFVKQVYTGQGQPQVINICFLCTLLVLSNSPKLPLKFPSGFVRMPAFPFPALKNKPSKQQTFFKMVACLLFSYMHVNCPSWPQQHEQNQKNFYSKTRLMGSICMNVKE